MFTDLMIKRKDCILQTFSNGFSKLLYKHVQTPADLVYIPADFLKAFFSCNDTLGLETLESQALSNGKKILQPLANQ